MRCVAGAPAFIQLESENKLTGVERVAGFKFIRFVSCWGQSRARHTFHSITWRMIAVIQLVSGVKPDKSGTVSHAISDITVRPLSNTDVICNSDFYGHPYRRRRESWKL